MKINSNVNQANLKHTGAAKTKAQGDTGVECLFGSDTFKSGACGDVPVLGYGCMGSDTAKASSKDFPPDCLFGGDTAKASPKDTDPVACAMGAETEKAGSGLILDQCMGAGTEKAGQSNNDLFPLAGCVGGDTEKAGGNYEDGDSCLKSLFGGETQKAGGNLNLGKLEL